MIIDYDLIIDDNFDPYKEFNLIVRLILEKNGFSVSENSTGEYDFNISYKEKEGLCEIKYYQSRFTPYDSVLIAARQLKSQQKLDFKTLLLIVNGVFPESYATEIFNVLGVQVWDITTLIALTEDLHDLYIRLDFLMTKSYGYGIYDLYYYNEKDKERIIPQFWENLVKAQKVDLDKLGEKLFKSIKEIKPGRREFVKYEKYCTELLKYLFKNDLELWEKQRITDDNLNRYDLICRINSTTKFWRDLGKDFNSRYVVFEFKNYKDQIGQAQIYTTEKYLFTKALRSISFIISRKGADKNAIKASKGALKESGKLIICLSDEDLFEISIAKDKGDAPEKKLMNILDKFLVEINR